MWLGTIIIYKVGGDPRVNFPRPFRIPLRMLSMVVISLFSSILLATSAFAFPSSESRYARRLSRSLQSSSHAATNSTSSMRDSNNWAGAAWDFEGGVRKENSCYEIVHVAYLCCRGLSRLLLAPSKYPGPKLPKAQYRCGWALMATPATTLFCRQVSTSASTAIPRTRVSYLLFSALACNPHTY